MDKYKLNFSVGSGLFIDLCVFIPLPLRARHCTEQISGTYGTVYKATDTQTGAFVAVKLFKQTKQGEGISLTAYREIGVSLRARSRCAFVKLFDSESLRCSYCENFVTRTLST